MSPLDIFVPQAEQSRELRTLMSSKCSKAEILSDVGIENRKRGEAGHGEREWVNPFNVETWELYELW